MADVQVEAVEVVHALQAEQPVLFAAIVQRLRADKLQARVAELEAAAEAAAEPVEG